MRLVKLVALLGFALPWFVISCAGKTLVEPRGYELALGLKIEAGADFSAPSIDAAAPDLIHRASISPTPGLQPPAPSIAAPKRAARAAPAIVQWLAGGAFFLLAGALLAGLWLRGPAFLSIAAGAGFAAAGLAYASVAGVEMEMQRSLVAMAKEHPLGALAMAQLDVTMQTLPGLWVTVGNAACAGAIAAVGLWRATRTPAPAPA